MADQDDVRRIARALPGVTEGRDRFGFSVDHKGKAKGFVWVWMEAADPEAFFTEPHYNGFPAVLIRLSKITLPVLRRVIVEAWRCMAPADLVAAHDAGEAPAAPKPRARRAPAARTGTSSTARRKRSRTSAT